MRSRTKLEASETTRLLEALLPVIILKSFLSKNAPCVSIVFFLFIFIVGRLVAAYPK